MRILISLSSKAIRIEQSFGPLQLKVQRADKNMYAVTWTNKMKNATANFAKMGQKNYLVSSAGPNLPETQLDTTDLKQGLLMFFGNCSVLKVSDEHILAARKWIGEIIKDYEGVHSLNIRIAVRGREQDNLHLPVTYGPVGAKKKGILLYILPLSVNCRVMVLNEDGSKGNVLEIPKDQIWID
jgi:hypothetical protein